EKQATRDFALAEYYRRTGKPTSAAFYYELVRRRYPSTPFAAKAADQLRNLQVPLPRAPAGAEERPVRGGQIIIVGNKKGSDAEILKAVPLVPGAVLSYPDLRAAERSLARLGVFRTRPTVTALDPEKGSAFQDILITVEEK